MLLSIVDHFNRVSKTQKVRRVVGVLLGSFRTNKELDIANSFAGACAFDGSVFHNNQQSAVPFDEDEKDSDVYFLDGDYLENMYAMFHKVAGVLLMAFIYSQVSNVVLL